MVCVAELRPGPASAQPASGWGVTLGGGADDFAHSVALAGDGGFVIAGETSSQGAGSRDGWLVKLNSDGVEQWRRTFGGSESDIFYSVRTTADGGFIAAGESQSFDDATSASSNFWLVKTDSRGQQLWRRTFGSSNESNDSDSMNFRRRTVCSGNKRWRFYPGWLVLERPGDVGTDGSNRLRRKSALGADLQ